MNVVVDLVALERDRERRAVEALLRSGVVSSPQLHCHYQPVVDLRTDRVVGHEALLRCAGPHGALSPAAVFATAARCGVEHRLDRRARELAVRDHGCPGLLLLNCAPPALTGSDDEVAALLDALEERGVEPHCLVLELTEHERADTDSLLAALAPYRERGVLVAVDDAGAGWSTMALVATVVPDVVKVDGDLFSAALTSRGAAAVVRSLVALAEDLDADVVAEGLESERHVDAARRAGIAWGQGYWLGRPRGVRDDCCGMRAAAVG